MTSTESFESKCASSHICTYDQKEAPLERVWCCLPSDQIEQKSDNVKTNLDKSYQERTLGTIVDTPNDDILNAMRSNTFEQKTESLFISFKFVKDTFQRLRYLCETIKGILTIFKQDFPKAPSLLDGNVISTNDVYVYTTEQIQCYFEDRSIKKANDLSMEYLMETIKQTESFALIVIDNSIVSTVLGALKDFGIRNTGVLIVGQHEVMLDNSNVCLNHTEIGNHLKAADVLLERCAFKILNTVESKLRRFARDKKLSVNEETKLQDVFDLIKSAFERSDIRSADFSEKEAAFKYPKKAIEDIVSIPGVVLCFNKRGTLQIYMDSSEVTAEKIRKKMEENEINDFNICSAKTKQLSQCSSGDSVFEAKGTLGGFVKKIPSEMFSVRANLSERCNHGRTNDHCTSRTNEAGMCALVSRHVVEQTQLQLLIVDNIDQPLGRIERMHPHHAIDIMPVDIDATYEHLCDTRFRTELGVSMYSELRTSGEIGILRGQPVHIWGAMSSPGYGMLVEHDANDNTGLKIIVRDRNTDVPFAQAGDSGAMVCYYDPYKEVLFAVAMLINSVQLEGEGCNRYTAQILDDGLQILSIANGCQFRIFDGGDST